MPIIVYRCNKLHTTKKFFRGVKDLPPSILCKCGEEANRTLSGPVMQSIVSMDNGVQSRAVNVDIKMVEAIQENSTKDFTKKD